jgi:type II secretory pathway component PulF
MARVMGLAACASFCRRVGTSLHAGVDMMMLLGTEMRNGDARHQTVMAKVHEGVANGGTLADSIVIADPVYFPRLMVSMIRLGEHTGRLERTLLQLADHYQHRLSTRRTFLMAIAWPALQLFAAIMVIGLLIFILGVLTPLGGGEMFDPLGWGLKGAGGAAIYFLFVFMIGFWIFLAVTAVRKNWFNLHAVVPIAYLIPKLGPSIQTITLARFTWTLSMALDAGLDPMRAIELSLDSTDSDYYRSETKKAQKRIREGKSLAESLAATEIFPREFISALEVAEMSGTDAESLGMLASDYDQRAKIAMRTLAGIFSAVIWLSVAGLLIYLILSMALNIVGEQNAILEDLGY